MARSTNRGVVPELERPSAQHGVKGALVAWHVKEE